MTGIQMDIGHLAARLEWLARYRTPGLPPPEGHYPAGEHLLLRDAARRLLRMDADLVVAEHLAVAKGEHWKHWAILTEAGEIVFAASLGPERAREHLRALVAENVPGAGACVVRPVILGRPA